MSINAITQPILKISTYAELIASSGMPDRCIAWVEDVQKLYVLESGTWMDLAELSASSVPRVWVDKNRKSSVKTVITQANVSSSGNVTFDLTDASNNAIFTNLYKGGCSFWVDSQVSYNFSSYSLAADKKSLTVKVSYPLIAALAIVYANASNGTTIYLIATGE